MNKQNTAIHVEFHTNGSHFYFGSIAAIYALFTREDIGVSRSRLYQVDIEPGKPYQNKLCTIRKGPLYRKKGNRKNI
jgi:hypothetical protein